MSYILGFFGSPRRGGNTEILLDETLRSAKEKGAQTEKIILNELNIRPCQECGGCDKTGRCVVKDDMQDIYPKLRRANSVIVASPVFFSSVSAQTKAMIDRNQCVWVEKYRLKKPVTEVTAPRRGALISTCAHEGKEHFACSIKVVETFFLCQNIDFFDRILVDKTFPSMDRKVYPVDKISSKEAIRKHPDPECSNFVRDTSGCRRLSSRKNYIRHILQHAYELGVALTGTPLPAERGHPSKYT